MFANFVFQALEGKQKELRYIAKEYQETEKENARLRQSVGKYQEDLATSLYASNLNLASDKFFILSLFTGASWK